MRHGLRVRWITTVSKDIGLIDAIVELDRSYAVKKKMQKKENRKKNGLKVDLSGFEDVLSSIQIKPKSELESQATHSKKIAEPVKEAAIPSNKIKSKKAKKQAE